jgi:hypothetical protein
MNIRKYIWIIGWFLGSIGAWAQEATVELGNKNIAQNEAFTITINLTNEEINEHSSFPEIQGFIKAGTSSKTSTTIINGDMSFIHSIVQTYLPQREGTFTLKPFTMKINGQSVRTQGETITVIAPREQQQQFDPFAYDPFEDLLQYQPREVVTNAKDDAFFAASVSKRDVFVGEGFNLCLSFFVAENNPTELQFYKTGEQLAKILKQIKPNNCWEENFGIEVIEAVPVIINQKRYNEYKIYQATYYPLNAETIKIPAVPLKLVRYKLVQGGGLFGQTIEEFKDFYSQATSIKVKELPPHPLRNAVPVGDYVLDERLSAGAVEAGKSIEYEFKVRGEGNLASLNAPTTLEQASAWEIYPPNVRQNIERRAGRVMGSKMFTYSILSKDTGTYQLADFFHLVFFNPAKQKYDTLRPKAAFSVTGMSKQIASISEADQDSFYRLIQTASNKISSTDYQDMLKSIANVLLLLMLLITIFFILKKS